MRELQPKFKIKFVFFDASDPTIAQRVQLSKMYRDVNFTDYEIDSENNWMLNIKMMKHIVPFLNNQGFNLPTDLNLNSFSDKKFSKIYDVIAKCIITQNTLYLDELDNLLSQEQKEQITTILGL